MSTIPERFQELVESDYAPTIIATVNKLYNELQKNNRADTTLKMINCMLKEINYDNIKRFEKFKVVYADLKKIDLEEFINNNDQTLKNLGLNVKNDLQYDPKKKRQKDILNVIDGLLKPLGYQLKKFNSSIVVDGAQKAVVKYKIINL